MVDSIFRFFDAIVGWAVTVGVAALALWGVRWKVRAVRAKQQIDDYQKSSNQWEMGARERVEEARRQAAGKAKIDPNKRTDFE